MAYDKENMNSKEDNVELANLIDSHINEDRKSTRLNSSHSQQSRMPSSAWKKKKKVKSKAEEQENQEKYYTE